MKSGTQRAATTMAMRRNGASHRLAMVGPSFGSSHNTRIGPNRKPTPNTTAK
jgi:hypothetical protein